MGSAQIFPGKLRFQTLNLLPEHYLYLILNALIISFPLLRSFEPRISYYKKWKALFSGIFLTGVLFIVWDIIFTAQGVWGFNERYLSGLEAFGLPLGEWLFFVTVPFSCVFIYEALVLYKVKGPGPAWTMRISNFLIALFLIGGIVFYSHLYTSVTFLLAFVFVILAQYVFVFPFLGRIYLSYIFVLLPFFLFNGILTGSFIEEEVVWYNDRENIGLRLGTIPFEDMFYGFLLIAMNISFYLKFQNRAI